MFNYKVNFNLLGLKCVFKRQDLRTFGLNMGNFDPLEVVGRGSEGLRL